MAIVRSFLQVAVTRDWEVYQMNVHNVFLHGDLEEEVFIRPTPGFRTADKNQVCRLHKSLYGLRQAPRCWFAKLSTTLLDYGFQQCVKDYSLFAFADADIRLHVLVYVDDLIITGSSRADLGISKYFLGIEVARNSTGMYLCQRKYTLDIISDTGLLGSKPASHPLKQDHTLALAPGDSLSDPYPYRQLVGRLIYLSVTRPDLSYVIHILSQFMHAPKAAHWAAALRVVRYLKSNPGQGILLQAGTDLRISAWCDSDHGGCPLSRRSLTAWVIQIGGSPVSWKTQKQDVVSRSSAEAEYRAMAETVCEILWLRELLTFLGVDCTSPVPLHCDNESAIHISKNLVFHERTKHIESDCHFIRDEILHGVIDPQHVSTRVQLADILTKALGRKEFDEFLSKLGYTVQ
ncbi:PREDICTED: uncharacterized protein LOC109129976 [Camelina sativa]|uniref:Uncharacterized protein LOC109129976 n=1 Tax=Camelina sativa TaxID=90675 RepID=A0ABM1R6F4_CAMSA|nr:PREDICTED: uncharacterized protein LOC109129976 [Camelina sativa]